MVATEGSGGILTHLFCFVICFRMDDISTCLYADGNEPVIGKNYRSMATG